MLATRPYEAENSHWHFGKYFSTAGKTATSPRMSDQYEASLPAQPDWHGSYPYLPQPAASVYSQSPDQNHANLEVIQPHTAAEGENTRLETHADRQAAVPPNQNHGLHRLGVHEIIHSSTIPESPERKVEVRGINTTSLLLDEPLASATSNQINSSPSTAKSPEDRFGAEDQLVTPKEEGDDMLIEEEIADDEPDSQSQTTAERAAARRKMKRFRLTHQQTRFLTSEFAKQPHPDAAHRERLSREIPGLSPRQVQVWFQNRRAKIKRLNADDRDRMVKMRAVPDDFDNVQALHSPYGAVHGLGMPLAPPVDFTAPSYGNSMIRPGPGADQTSPNGLAPTFGSMGFNTSGGMSTSGIISPISPNLNGRYHHGGNPPTALGGPHGSLDNAMQAHRHGIRPIQPFHVRESMSRPRSESLQPYYLFSGVNQQNNMPERSSLSYQPGPMGQSLSNNNTGLDRSSYSHSGNTQSPTGLSYSNYQHSPQSESRRATSASLPPNNVDQYRPLRSPPQIHDGRSARSPLHYGGPSNY